MTTKTEINPLRTAVLISGSGRTLKNFIDLAAADRLPIDIRLVISSRPDAGGLTLARRAGLPTKIIAPKQNPGPAFSKTITAALDEVRPDLICLAGFLAFWEIPPHYDGKVLNIHPALLPEFGGKGFFGHHVHEAVLAAGRSESGVTVHFADNQYDHGPIILQRRIPVLPDDTADMLADRVFQAELIAYPQAIRLFAQNRLAIQGNTVTITEASNNKN